MAETTSLYEIIVKALDETGTLPSNFALPKEEFGAEKIAFADGAKDGVTLFHIGAKDADASLLTKALDLASEGNMEEAHIKVKEFAMKGHMLCCVNAVRNYITTNHEKLNPASVMKLAAECAFMGSLREEVKFGLTILELFNTDDDVRMKGSIRVLSLCDEFTLFALFIMRHWSASSHEIFLTAKRTFGWGRIHAVEYLKAETEEMERWMLEVGWKNKIHPSYSAFTVYKKVHFVNRMKHNPSDTDFLAAVQLLEVLMSEGPGPGVAAINNADDMISAFFKAAEDRELSVRQRDLVRVLGGYAQSRGWLPLYKKAKQLVNK